MADSPATHREHLGVPVGWWVLGALFALSIVVAVAAYTNAWFAMATAVVSLLGLGALFIGYGRAPVVVDDGGLTAGRARVEWPWVRQVEVLDARQMRDALGPRARGTEYLLVRPYVGGGVRVVLDDPADPHPCWLVSSRHPRRLVAAAGEHLGAS